MMGYSNAERSTSQNIQGQQDRPAVTARFADNRNSSDSQLQLQRMMNSSSLALAQCKIQTSMQPSLITQTQAIQCYAYGAGTTRSVTVKGSGGKQRTFEECTYNYVDYKTGDAKQAGTGTTSPAAWATWLVNKKGGRNATQLHVVNGRWGGKGGKDDKNIVPGSPAENSHHLHEAEKKFDEICFNNTNTAVQDAKYECTATPKYSVAEDVSGGAKSFGDPTLSVTITTGTGSKTFPVTDGSEGLVIQEGD